MAAMRTTCYSCLSLPQMQDGVVVLYPLAKSRATSWVHLAHISGISRKVRLGWHYLPIGEGLLLILYVVALNSPAFLRLSASPMVA